MYFKMHFKFTSITLKSSDFSLKNNLFFTSSFNVKLTSPFLNQIIIFYSEKQLFLFYFMKRLERKSLIHSILINGLSRNSYINKERRHKKKERKKHHIFVIFVKNKKALFHLESCVDFGMIASSVCRNLSFHFFCFQISLKM